jgi:hypothetical protein
MRPDYQPDYKAISDSIDIFHKWARRGMIMGQIKEKYYSTRWYAYLGTALSLHSIFYPQHIYNRFPKWLHKLDYKVFIPFFRYTGMSYLFGKWQVFCYKQAYKEVLTKYPHVDHCINFEELVSQYRRKDE